MKRVHTSCIGLAALLVVSPGCSTLSPSRDATQADQQAEDFNPQRLNEKKSAKLCLSTAKRLQAEGYHAKAAVLYEKARHHDPSVDVSHALAILYARLDLTKRADAEFEEALRLAPDDPNLLNDYGCYCLRRGALDLATQLLALALEIQPDHPQALMNLGECHIRSGRLKEGVDLYRQHCGEAAAYSNAGVLMASMGEADYARELFAMALERNPDLPAANAFLAQLDPQVEPDVQLASATDE